MSEKLKHKVAVYGSLLEGLGNHGLLKRYIDIEEAELLGEDQTEELFTMGSLAGGYFPGLSEDSKVNRIHVEVYSISDAALHSVRRLEGYNTEGTGLYNEKIIDTKFGKSIIYIYNGGLPNAISPDKNNVVNWKAFKKKV